MNLGMARNSKDLASTISQPAQQSRIDGGRDYGTTGKAVSAVGDGYAQGTTPDAAGIQAETGC